MKGTGTTDQNGVLRRDEGEPLHESEKITIIKIMVLSNYFIHTHMKHKN